MVCKAFSVLTVIVKIERHAQIFSNPAALKDMCERIALPNIGLRGK
jgi:exportin-2 (importin alpha re-exporter)